MYVVYVCMSYMYVKCIRVTISSHFWQLKIGLVSKMESTNVLW